MNNKKAEVTFRFFVLCDNIFMQLSKSVQEILEYLYL